tara:strand:- start:665 stop:1024 length:360 start_codon:yes stop_codon:yes gene_type:complete
MARIVFFNDFIDGADASQIYRSVYVSDVPVSAIEMNIIQLLRASEGIVMWKGKFVYMAYPGENPEEGFVAGTPLMYYLSLHDQNVQPADDGNVYVMLRTVNPEDNATYQGMGFARLPTS